MASATLTDPERLLEHASHVVGREHVGPGRVVAPADEQQAAQVLRFADENGITVGVQGSGTKAAWTAGPRTMMALSTSRMHAVVDHTWQDMTCTVQAGCTWAALQARLGEQGQFVALDPLWADRATVGGVVATNDSGALRLRYGGLRDLLIGMTVVLADGTIAKSGGKVVKNVAGYDLPKLMCGSYGTLALITDVTFRLHSRPLHTLSLTATAATAGPLGKAMLQVMDRHISTQAMQLRGGPGGFALDVRLMAVPAVAEHQRALLTALDSSFGPGEEGIWSARQGVFDTRGDGFVFKVTTVTTGLVAAVQAIADAGGEAVAQSVGIAYGWLPAEAAPALLDLRREIEDNGGSMQVLRGVSPAVDAWGRLPDSTALMREVKRQFDARATLNPGHFLGGI